MKRFGSLVTAIVLWGAAGAALAETVSIQQALEQALLNNPGIERQRRQLQSERLAKSVAQAGHYPELELQAGVTRYSEPTLAWPIHEAGSFPPFAEDIASIGLNLRLPLYVGGKLVAAVNLAEKQILAARLRLEASRQELIFNVASAYGKTLQLQQQRDAMQHRIRGLESQYADTQERLRSGRVAQIDLARVKTRLSEARYEMAALEQGVGNGLQLLAMLTGESEAPTQLVARMEVTLPAANTTLAQWSDQALANHPSLQRARSGIDAAGERIEMARGERRPQLHLIGNGRHLESGDGEGQDEWQVGLQLSVPLYDGAARRDRVSQAVIAREVAQLEMQELADSLRYQVREAHADVATGELQLRVAEQGLREAEEVLRIETLRYKTGTSTITELLGAEADLWSARAKRVQAHYDLTLSKSSLLKAAGLLGPESFSAAVPRQGE
ncbi:MAG: TolC family protein [Gammaproteobacteria bacterium]|nr:TolC family protein [Gammaproteobacteria bacterium]